MTTIRFGNYLTDYSYTIKTGDSLSKSWYKSVCQFLFQLAADGIENRQVYAYIYTGESVVHLVECFTTVDGSTITAHIYVNGQHVRNMRIAW